MIINQTRIETPTQTFVSSSTSTNVPSYIKYVIKEKTKNVIILSSDEENSDDEEPAQPAAQPMDEEPQTVSLSASTRPNKQRKIEGSQNAPISLDDSDDDMAEIIDAPESFSNLKKGPIDNNLTQSIASSVASSPMAQYEDYGDDSPAMDEETFQQNLSKFLSSSNEDKKDELIGELNQEMNNGLNQELNNSMNQELNNDMNLGTSNDWNQETNNESKQEVNNELNPEFDQESSDKANDESDKEMNSGSLEEMISGLTEELNVGSTEEMITGSIEDMTTGSTENIVTGSTEELKIGLQGGLNSGLIGEFTYAVNGDSNTEETSADAMAIDNPTDDQSDALNTDQIMDQNDAQNNNVINDQYDAQIDDELDDSFSVLSELSDVVFEQLSSISVREDSVKEEELHNALNITETVSYISLLQKNYAV